MGFFEKMFGNRNETVDAIARDLVVTSMTCGQEFVNKMVSDNNGSATSNSSSVTLATNELFYFFMHFVNRLAQSLGAADCNQKLVGGIFVSALEVFRSGVPEKYRNDVVSILKEGAADAESIYSDCKLVNENKEGLKGTLFWEAAKRVSSAAGGGTDVANIFTATAIMTDALESLKIGKRVKSLSKSIME